MLVGLFLVQAAGGDVEQEAGRVAALRAAGARWGLVAAELGVDAAVLSRLVDEGLGRATAAVDRRASSPRPTEVAQGARQRPESRACPTSSLTCGTSWFAADRRTGSASAAAARAGGGDTRALALSTGRSAG